MFRKVGCILYLASLLVGCLVGSVMKVNIYGTVNKKRAASGFVLQVFLGVSLCVSVTFKFQVSCETIYKLS